MTGSCAHGFPFGGTGCETCDTPVVQAPPPRKWVWMGGVESSWSRIGLGVEFSFLHWTPPEWSVHVHLGPVLISIGWEENWAWREWLWERDSIPTHSKQHVPVEGK